jgi:hypothetical protein
VLYRIRVSRCNWAILLRVRCVDGDLFVIIIVGNANRIENAIIGVMKILRRICISKKRQLHQLIIFPLHPNAYSLLLENNQQTTNSLLPQVNF